MKYGLTCDEAHSTVETMVLYVLSKNVAD